MFNRAKAHMRVAVQKDLVWNKVFSLLIIQSLNTIIDFGFEKILWG